jgi:hypothetical protein
MTRHGHYTLGGENPPKSTYYEQGKFGRLFPMLPPFATDTPTVRNALMELGKKGGIWMPPMRWISLQILTSRGT